MKEFKDYDSIPYSVTYPTELRIACCMNDWFNAGNSKQYEKLFIANESGASLDAIAGIIWACTNAPDWDGEKIKKELEKMHADYCELKEGKKNEAG